MTDNSPSENSILRKASREFQVFAKPAGASCNLQCQYCYYLEKLPHHPPIESLRMPDDILELYIIRHIEASPGPAITFSWHGGEPTLLGLEYFKRIVALQRKHRSHNQRIFNGMQTNGILLNEEWCRFLAAEHFGVGLSLDGPAELHDLYRFNRGGESTHRQTLHAFENLKRYGVTCDILCALHDKNVRQPLEVYRFFRDIGARYIGFLPIVKREPGTSTGVSSHTVPADAFGEFLCTIFDEGAHRDMGHIAVQMFEEAARPVQGMDHSLCIFRETCGDIPVVEHNGNFYSCDHYVDEMHLVGNIRETPLSELLDSPAQIAFGEAKRVTLPRYCRQCEVLAMCHGGCPKDRFVSTPDGEPGLNYLCPGLRRFFVHSGPFYQKVAALARARETSRVKNPVAGRNTSPGVGRNDPCPCGSGLKYKKCCLGK